MESESLSEELRVLYVALTRAREKLVILCADTNMEKKLSPLVSEELPVHPQVLSGASSIAEWILIPALHRPESAPIRFGKYFIPAEDEDTWDVRYINELPKIPRRRNAPDDTEEIVDETKLKELASILEYKYPYMTATKLPSKITATELKGTYRFSEAAEEAESLNEVPQITEPTTPAFMDGKKGLTAAEKGTATHIVMQFADYEKCRSVDGAKSEIERLKNNRTITEEQAAAVNPWVITRFFESEPGKLIISAEKLWRELKFSVMVSPTELGGEDDDERLLLQGVVDCCVLKDGRLTIIDFKTDYVTEETVNEKTELYSGQLEAYKVAMTKMLGLPVERKILCFLTAGLHREL
jgi:ATP-dependent helicase/nuclease subunit A